MRPRSNSDIQDRNYSNLTGPISQKIHLCLRAEGASTRQNSRFRVDKRLQCDSIRTRGWQRPVFFWPRVVRFLKFRVGFPRCICSWCDYPTKGLIGVYELINEGWTIGPVLFTTVNDSCHTPQSAIKAVAPSSFLQIRNPAQVVKIFLSRGDAYSTVAIQSFRRQANPVSYNNKNSA